MNRAVGWLCLGLLGCADDPASTATGVCSVSVGGEAIAHDLPEATIDLDGAVADVDLLSLADPVDTTALDPLSAALLAYTVELPLDEVQPSLALAAIDARLPALADVVRASFLTSDTFDTGLLRAGLQRWYACDRDLPPTLDAFRETYGDWTDRPPALVPLSVPKRAPRALFEEPERGLFVAESADASGAIETEIVLAGVRADGALDFLAYDADGVLRNTAMLAFGATLEPQPAPYACALCHRDLLANTFTVIAP